MIVSSNRNPKTHADKFPTRVEHVGVTYFYMEFF